MQENGPAKTPAPREDVMALIDLLNQGKLIEAIAHGERLARTYAPSVPLYNMLGSASIDANRKEQAVEWFGKALQLAPNDVDTLYNMGITSQRLGRRSDAIHCYERILKIKPERSQILALKLLQHAHMCDWKALGAAAGQIADLGLEGEIISPFIPLALEDRPGRHLIRSRRYAAQMIKPSPLPPPARPAAEPARLRIGYFSAEVHNHPVSRLIARILELHDRARFEVHVYSYGPAMDDETRQRITRAADGFHEVSKFNEEGIARLARQHGIDIAIDLTGHTTNSRTGLFALRPAPVQISYLGYPGTSGAPFIDYIVADRVLIPEDRRHFYTEAPIYLPHCYQAQDDQARIADRPSRASLGLPETGFIFCGINGSSKIRPELYDIWMRLLRQVDGSVLWLLKSNPWAEKNLQDEAAARGVDPARIIFAGWKPFPEYLAQFGCADLFLDSFIYNAGATASNALWAGLPVLTRIGDGYIARMAASMLTTIGLPELITTSDEAYERLALELATDPERLAAIRARLWRNRTATPMFDSLRFTRQLEEAYRLVWRRWFAGEARAAIDVPAVAPSD